MLRGQLGFRGVVISDWKRHRERCGTKYHVVDNMEDAVALAINAGIDMSMIPLAPDNKYDGRPTGCVEADRRRRARQGLAGADRRVGRARILRLKFQLGLFERPYVDPERARPRSSTTRPHAPLARKAARESLVLLENDGVLPLSRGGGRKILVTGPQSDSAGNQLGGWTIGWQGAFNLPTG